MLSIYTAPNAEGPQSNDHASHHEARSTSETQKKRAHQGTTYQYVGTGCTGTVLVEKRVERSKITSADYTQADRKAL